MSNRHRFLRQRFSSVLLAFLLICQQLTAACASDTLDRVLIDSLIARDIDSARRALEKGADPEAIMGRNLNDNAMCTAIDSRSSRFLELLVEFGASPNAYLNTSHPFRRTPLACAVFLLNFEAFEYLLAHGADPSVDLYPESSEKHRNWQTAFTLALDMRYYPMALELIDRYELAPGELHGLVFELERYHYDEAHPWNYAREALIDWASQRVTDFNPKPAYPAPEGVDQECRFSFRDIEEGLDKGTICHRPEDRRVSD